MGWTLYNVMHTADRNGIGGRWVCDGIYFYGRNAGVEGMGFAEPK